MKGNLLLKAMTMACLCLSGGAFALEKVVITGEPVVLEKKAGVYVLPSTVNRSADYYYIRDVKGPGVSQVCYRSPQPNLVRLGFDTLSVMLGDTATKIYCYTYSTDYFTTTTTEEVAY